MALIDFSTAAVPSSGDFAPGAGLTTLGRTQETSLAAAGQNDSGFPTTVVGSASAHNGATGNVVPWWIGLIVLLVIVKFIAEKNDEAGEFKNIRVGFFNIIIVTIMAIIGLTLMKWFFALYAIPGLSPIVEAV